MAAVKPMLIGVGAQAITGGVQKSSTASSYFDRVLSFSGLRELADSAANGEGADADIRCYLINPAYTKGTDVPAICDLDDVTVEDVVQDLRNPDIGNYVVIVGVTQEGRDLAARLGLPVLTPGKGSHVINTLYKGSGLAAPIGNTARPAASPAPASPSAAGFSPAKPAQPSPVKAAAPWNSAKAASAPAPEKQASAPKPAAKNVWASAQRRSEDQSAPASPSRVSGPSRAAQDTKADTFPKPSAARKPVQRSTSPGAGGKTMVERGPQVVRGKAVNPWTAAKNAESGHRTRTLAPVQGASSAWARAGQEARRSGLSIGQQGKPWGTVLVWASRKGGVGKTTWAVNSAEQLGKMLPDRRICLVDMNVQQGDAKYLLGRDSPNVSNLVHQSHLLSSPEMLEEVLVDSPTGHFKALLAPANNLESDPNTINTTLYEQVIALLQQRFDIIVVDTPVGERWHANMEFILDAANFILVPVTSSRTTVVGVKAWLDDICKDKSVAEGLGIDRNKIGILINRYHDNVDFSISDITKIMTGYKFLGGVKDSPIWQLAENNSRILAADLPPRLEPVFNAILYAATGLPDLNKAVPTQRKAPPKTASKGKIPALISRILMGT